MNATSAASTLNAASSAAPGRVRTVALWVALGAAPIVAIVAALTAGRYPIEPGVVLAIVASWLFGGPASWTLEQATVVEVVRLPRALVSACAGAGLGVAGAALQGVFRNPLVGPQIIGVSAGAGFGGAAGLLVGAGTGLVVGSAFAGGLAALAAVLMLGRIDGRSPVLVLVLAGLVIGAFFTALTSVLVFVADPERKLPGIVFWLLGSFATADITKLAVVAAATLTGGGVLTALAWRINVLSLGDDDARALGIRVDLTRATILTAATLVVAAQVSVSGIIGWVGLIVPHVARMLVGADHTRLLPAAALLGAAYLIIVDMLSRSLTSAEIPLGILTAIVGAPVFAVLLRLYFQRGWSHA